MLVDRVVTDRRRRLLTSWIGWRLMKRLMVNLREGLSC